MIEYFDTMADGESGTTSSMVGPNAAVAAVHAINPALHGTVSTFDSPSDRTQNCSPTPESQLLFWELLT